jgi:uncharacterized RDD family membrane protein YckC
MQSRWDNTNVSAGFFPRAAALLIDCLLVGFVTSFIKIIAFFAGLAMGVTLPNVLFRYDAIDIICYMIGAAYFVIFTGLTGSTLGKKAMKLQVVRDDGSPIGFFDALYRETIGRYLTSILFIGYIVAAFNPENKGFHDMLADTRVVYALPKHRETITVMEEPQGQQN